MVHLSDTSLVENTPLIGRERELLELEGLARDHRLVTIVGPGGLGKTRLAVETSRRVGGSEAAWVDLSPVTDGVGLVSAVAYALGVAEADERDLATVVRQRLASATVLLVLDNLEQVAGAGRVISRWLTDSPNLRILATSRRPLRLRTEQVYRPGPLAARGTTAAGPTLFVERARALGDEISSSQMDAVSELCARLDGLPLAIELAAAQTTAFSPRELLRRLTEGGFELRGHADLPARQQTLGSVVAWSHELLSAQSRDAFPLLSVFAGSFDMDAAGAVVRNASAVMAELLDHSLLVRVGQDRYRMLETVRTVASGMPSTEPGIADARKRHAAHYLGLARDAKAGLDSSDVQAWAARLDADRHNLRAALGWYVAQEDRPNAAALALALDRYWMDRGWLSEGRRWLATVMTLGMEDRARTAAAWGSGVGMSAGAGRWEKVAGTAATAEAAITADLLRADAGLAWYQGQLDQAYEALVRARDINVRDGRHAPLASTLLLLIDIPRQRGAYDEAEKAAKEAIDLSRRIGDLRTEAKATGNLALVWHDMGRAAESVQGLRAAIELFDKAGDERGKLLGLINLAAVDDQDGETQLRHSLDALAAAEGLGDHGLEGIAAVNAGNALRKLGRPADAAPMIQRGIRQLLNSEDAIGAAKAVDAAAVLLAESDRLHEARIAAAGAAAEFARRGIAWERDGLFTELGPLDGQADGLSFQDVIARTQLALESIAQSSSDASELGASDY
jgi:predicted ATPase